MQDATRFFIIGKALEGIKRIQGGKRNDIRAPAQILTFCTLECGCKYLTEEKRSKLSGQKLCNRKWGKDVVLENIRASEVSLYRTDGTHL
ncbi:Hypothetical predicted protein [Mytilus galloprovincialis]|uniref:Uncharacterized protein n=1 Tax=Mytilus galloprovincialis TaxID=29158 RepID=A0A8B6GE77_MYTGA|nr:Hypothetical predicted protein [Mytilus galloprovincialis]